MSLAISGEQFPGSIQMRVLANTGENIENLSPVRPGVLHTVRGQDRQSIMRGKIDKLLINTFLSAQKMSLNFNEHLLVPESFDQQFGTVCGIPGSARVSRADDDVLAIADFHCACYHRGRLFRRDAETSTRDACATQKRNKSLSELRQLIPLNRALPFLAAQMRLGQ